MNNAKFTLGMVSAIILLLLLTGCEGMTEPIHTPTTTKSTLLPSLTHTTIPTSTSNLTPVPGFTPTQTSTATLTPSPVIPADLIFYNGTLITIEQNQPIAEAIAIRDGLIQAVGTNEQILTLKGSETITIDLRGQTMMPGFVDPHTHIFNDASRYLGSNDYLQAQQLALRNGITTVGDMYSNSDFVAEMQTMDRAGQLHVRTSLYMAYTTPCGELTGDWYRQYPPTREFGEMLRIGGLKLFADGGVCGNLALSYCRPDIGCYGDLWFTQDEMNAMVDSLDTAGYQLAIHALGDRAIEQVLNAIQLALDGQPNTLRHRIEHNATLRSDLIPRYSETGVVATIFGSFWACVAEAAPPPAGYHTDWEWPYRALVDANPDVDIAWHSDYPWVGPASPLLHLYSMVTPYEIFTNDKTQCADPAWLPGKTFKVDEALPMMTIEGAYALFRDEEVGSLAAGKFADLIVLSGDPITIDPLEIKNLEVWMTMVGGEVEWCAPGHEALCP
jgi:predicted amidohydrolase YtcJ